MPVPFTFTVLSDDRAGPRRETMAGVVTNMMFSASLSTLVCMFAIVYSLALCLLAGNSTVIGAAMDAAMTFLVDWCFPSACQFLVYLLVKCCIASTSSSKKSVKYIAQAAADICMPVQPILSDAGVFLLDCAALLVLDAFHSLLEVTKSAFNPREEHNTADCAPAAEDPVQSFTDAGDCDGAEAEPTSCDTSTAMTTQVAEQEVTEDVNSDVVEPQTPERLSDSQPDSYSLAEPTLSGESSVDSSASACSSSYNSCTSGNSSTGDNGSSSNINSRIVASLAAAYKRNLAVPFVHHAQEVTAAKPGTVDYFVWSCNERIEALRESDADAAGPQPEPVTDEELTKLGIMPGTVECLSDMVNVHNEAMEAFNLRLRHLC